MFARKIHFRNFVCALFTLKYKNQTMANIILIIESQTRHEDYFDHKDKINLRFRKYII